MSADSGARDLGSADAGIDALRKVVDTRLHDILDRRQPGTLRVAFSGGLDSTVLLDLLSSIELPDGWSLSLAHVNHGLAAEADQWQAHCKSIAEKYGLCCEVARLEVARSGNVEANARAARYQFFAELAQANDLFLTAHHADDQVETVLLKLLQGRAFKGMAEVSKVEGVTIFRPLLATAQTELVAYGQARQLSWVEDPSNADVGYDRNYLRARILPALVSRWPEIREKLARRLVSNEAIGDVAKFEIDRYRAQNPDGVRIVDLPSDPYAAIAWLRLYLETGGHYQVTDAALKEFVTQVRAERRAKVAWRGGGLVVRRALICMVKD